MENFGLRNEDSFIWIIFIFTTAITQIVFMNMIIAIMGNTYAKVSAIKEQGALREKIQTLADYVVLVPRETVAKKNLDRFIFALSPTSLSQDENGNWEGTVTALQKAINISTT